jgi:hypothetical protein
MPPLTVIMFAYIRLTDLMDCSRKMGADMRRRDMRIGGAPAGTNKTVSFTYLSFSTSAIIGKCFRFFQGGEHYST